MEKSLTQLAADIVAAQASQRSMSAEELAELLKQTYESLAGLQRREEGTAPAEAPAPVAGPLEKLRSRPASSIQKNQVLCLECGATFKQLTSGHLKEHDLTPKEYRKKWGFSARQALSSQTLSAQRKKTAEGRNAGSILKEARKRKAAERRAQAQAEEKPKTILRKKTKE